MSFYQTIQSTTLKCGCREYEERFEDYHQCISRVGKQWKECCTLHGGQLPTRHTNDRADEEAIRADKLEAARNGLERALELVKLYQQEAEMHRQQIASLTVT